MSVPLRWRDRADRAEADRPRGPWSVDRQSLPPQV